MTCPWSFEIGRLDQDLFRTDTRTVGSLRESASVGYYGEFYRIYIEDILQGAPIEDPRLPLMLERFRYRPRLDRYATCSGQRAR